MLTRAAQLVDCLRAILCVAVELPFLPLHDTPLGHYHDQDSEDNVVASGEEDQGVDVVEGLRVHERRACEAAHLIRAPALKPGAKARVRVTRGDVVRVTGRREVDQVAVGRAVKRVDGRRHDRLAVAVNVRRELPGRAGGAEQRVVAVDRAEAAVRERLPHDLVRVLQHCLLGGDVLHTAAGIQRDRGLVQVAPVVVAQRAAGSARDPRRVRRRAGQRFVIFIARDPLRERVRHAEPRDLVLTCQQHQRDEAHKHQLLLDL